MSTLRVTRRRGVAPKVVASGSPGLSRTFEILTPLPQTIAPHSNSHSLASLEMDFGPVDAGGFLGSDVVKAVVKKGDFSGDDEDTVEDTGTFFGVKTSFNCRTSMTA